jgi:acetyl-CoA acetyltransferase
MWKLQDKYAIAGIGFTKFSKNSGRTVRHLASEACLAAVADAGIALNEIDGFCSFQMGDSVQGIAVATELGIPDVKWAVDLYGGGNAANLIVSNAAAAIEAGMATNVLCFRAMNGRSGYRFGSGGNASRAAAITQYTAISTNTG